MKFKTKVIKVVETDSTNRLIKQYLSDEADILALVADYQSAGRGQGANTWESSKGENLLFSLLVHPSQVPVCRQYLLSMMGAVALKMALSGYIDDITLKWPNDIYWKDKKISGTLIENTLSNGHIKDCVFGVGLDVNQKNFASDAPNPISIATILGHDVDREELFDKIICSFEKCYSLLLEGGYSDIAALYHDSLYRKHGFHLYEDATGPFEGAIVEVEDDGHLVLRDREGVMRRYAFKEVKFVIDKN